MEAIQIVAAHDLFSIGDIATVQATREQLALRGIPAIDGFDPQRRSVVGGGHIIGPQPHLSRYRIPGANILNAVAVNEDGDYAYLTNYAYRSVRDQVSYERLGMAAEIVPCPAVLLDPWKRREGDHGFVVAHNDPVVMDSIRSYTGRVKVVDPQPWRQNKWAASGEIIQATGNARDMLQTISGAHAVVCRSLHLSIFALAVGAPFACLDCGDEPQSNKMRDYWTSRNMPEVMCDGNPIKHAARLATDWQGHRTAERGRAIRHFDEMVRSL